MLSKLKNFVKNNSSDVFIILTVILVALISFGVGRLSAPKTEPIQIKNLKQANYNDLELETEETENTDIVYQGKVVASAKGTKYHLPECPGAKQISEQNKIWFNPPQDAEKAGYEPAANCPELQK